MLFNVEINVYTFMSIVSIVEEENEPHTKTERKIEVNVQSKISFCSSTFMPYLT